MPQPQAPSPEPCECTKRHEHLQWPGGHPASLSAAAARLECYRMFWGARKPCTEYDDGRELCAACEVRAMLAGVPA